MPSCTWKRPHGPTTHGAWAIDATHAQIREHTHATHVDIQVKYFLHIYGCKSSFRNKVTVEHNFSFKSTPHFPVRVDLFFYFADVLFCDQITLVVFSKEWRRQRGTEDKIPRWSEVCVRSLCYPYPPYMLLIVRALIWVSYRSRRFFRAFVGTSSNTIFDFYCHFSPFMALQTCFECLKCHINAAATLKQRKFY